MLLPAQVAPFLGHDDVYVRRLAIGYFGFCGDPAPVTADDFWTAIDRVADDEQAAAIAGGLAGVPQTDASIQRLIAALAGEPSEAMDESLQEAARAVDFPLLVKHRESLVNCYGMRRDVAAHLQRRLELADVPADAVWEQSLAFAVASEDIELDELDYDEADALTEAAARHIDVLAPRIMALLADEDLVDWRVTLAVEAVGLARHAPAVPLLLGKFSTDVDFVDDEVAHALARIGTDEVIDQVLAFQKGKPHQQRMLTSDVLGRMKRPAAEAALVSLLAHEQHGDVIARELHGLCDLASLGAMKVARKWIAVEPELPETIDLCERLLAAAIMNGVALPEEADWRALVAQRDAHDAALRAELESGDLSSFARRMRDLADDRGDDEWDDDGLPPAPLPGQYDSYARIEPIRNAEPKVGRNDPCPCGSGKKFKKCHGAPK